jgi:hypothetical protein
MHRQNEPGFFRLRLDLLAQVHDVRIDRASGWKAIVAPDFLEQTIAA